MAEAVAKVFPELVIRGAEGKPFTVRYHLLTPLLGAEVQKLNELLEDQHREHRKVVAELRRTVDRQKRRDSKPSRETDQLLNKPD